MLDSADGGADGGAGPDDDDHLQAIQTKLGESDVGSFVGERGGVLIFLHGRSRMTIDPRVLTMPGRSKSGFHRPDRHR